MAENTTAMALGRGGQQRQLFTSLLIINYDHILPIWLPAWIFSSQIPPSVSFVCELRKAETSLCNGGQILQRRKFQRQYGVGCTYIKYDAL